jgi:hypothetical protein
MCGRISEGVVHQAVCAQDEDTNLSLAQLLQGPYGIATVGVEALALVGMAPFLYIELCSFIEYGPLEWINSFW